MNNPCSINREVEGPIKWHLLNGALSQEGREVSHVDKRFVE